MQRGKVIVYWSYGCFHLFFSLLNSLWPAPLHPSHVHLLVYGLSDLFLQVSRSCSPAAPLSQTLNHLRLSFPHSVSARALWGGPLILKRLSIKKSIPSTCSLWAPQQPLPETDRKANSYKSALLRYLWPTWGKIYAGWVLESVYQALTEGPRAAGGGELRQNRRRFRGWRRGWNERLCHRREKRIREEGRRKIRQKDFSDTRRSPELDEMCSSRESGQAGRWMRRGLLRGRKAVPGCYHEPWINCGCHIWITWEQPHTYHPAATSRTPSGCQVTKSCSDIWLKVCTSYHSAAVLRLYALVSRQVQPHAQLSLQNR